MEYTYSSKERLQEAVKTLGVEEVITSDFFSYFCFQDKNTGKIRDFLLEKLLEIKNADLYDENTLNKSLSEIKGALDALQSKGYFGSEQENISWHIMNWRKGFQNISF